MAKNTLKVETSAGEFTRKTDTPYTHVVVRVSPRAAASLAAFGAGNYRGKLSGVDARWVKDRGYAVTWHNSEAAARAAAEKPYVWDRETSLVGVFEVAAAPAAADNLSGWVPEDDPDAWKARDAALIAAAATKRKA